MTNTTFTDPVVFLDPQLYTVVEGRASTSVCIVVVGQLQRSIIVDVTTSSASAQG